MGFPQIKSCMCIPALSRHTATCLHCVCGGVGLADGRGAVVGSIGLGVNVRLTSFCQRFVVTLGEGYLTDAVCFGVGDAGAGGSECCKGRKRVPGCRLSLICSLK